LAIADCQLKRCFGTNEVVCPLKVLDGFAQKVTPAQKVMSLHKKSIEIEKAPT
jgi:hypothetical protein